MTARKGPETGVSILCTLIFGAFIFLYLLFFQCDLLAYAQRSLSGGATSYNAVIGAVIITSVLLLLSLLTSRVFACHFSFAPALWHLPSALALAAVCDIHVKDAGETGVFGNWWIFCIVIFVLLIIANYFVKWAYFRFSSLTQALSVNLLLLLGILLLPVCIGNTDKEDHVRLRAERYVLRGEYGRVQELAHKYKLCTPELTMVRAFALAKNGTLGEEFFEEPVAGGSDNLLPSDANRLLLIPELDVFKTIGGVPGEGISARYCLEKLHATDSIHAGKKDYLLTACLMDRDLDAFADYFREDYDSLAAVPKHYREALFLYCRQHGGAEAMPQIPELEADFDDFQSMLKRGKRADKAGSDIRKTYGNTYWYYFFFTNSNAFAQLVSSENCVRKF